MRRSGFPVICVGCHVRVAKQVNDVHVVHPQQETALGTVQAPLSPGLWPHNKTDEREHKACHVGKLILKPKLVEAGGRQQ